MFHDVASVAVVSFKSFLWRWPPHRELVDKLKSLRKTRVNFIDLRALFPGSSLCSEPSSRPYLSLKLNLDLDLKPEA